LLSEDLSGQRAEGKGQRAKVIALVKSAIRRHEMLAPGDRVLVAISGGPDSVALALVLQELGATAPGWTVAGLAHVHHGLRGAEADADEAFCRVFAERCGVPIDVTRVEVANRAREAGRSMESAAREARYQALSAAAARVGATRIATGHTEDDQAETVLLRLFRGTGTRGLTGIRPRRGAIIRPLIDCTREDVERYLTARGEAYRRDGSNNDLSIARNRIRHEVLPVVDRIAPGARRALARLAAQAGDLDAFVTRAAANVSSRIVVSTDVGRVRLDAGAIVELMPALARQVLLQAIDEATPGTHISAGHLEAIRRLAAADKHGGHLDLPGLTAEREGNTVVVTGRAGLRQTVQPVCFERPLDVPGDVAVPEAGVTISAARAGRLSQPWPWPPAIAALQAASVEAPFVVRSRRPGDRLWPLGAPGHRKLQDVLVDRKVPRDARDRVPVVADARGRIVWIAGITMAEECRVTSPEAGMVILEMKQYS
jgi:tRNA(Ile)-lysidine synthase